MSKDVLSPFFLLCLPAPSPSLRYTVGAPVPYLSVASCPTLTNREYVRASLSRYHQFRTCISLDSICTVVGSSCAGPSLINVSTSQDHVFKTSQCLKEAERQRPHTRPRPPTRLGFSKGQAGLQLCGFASRNICMSAKGQTHVRLI